MKISNSYLFSQANKNIQSAQSDVAKSREKIATGKSLVRPSDDTSKLRSIELLKSQQRKIESYDKGMNFLEERYKLEESVLSSASDILIRVKELAIQAANDTLSTADRDIIATEVDNLRDELIAIANSRDVSGNYIFSGSKSDSQPFVTNETTGAVNYSGDNRALFTAVSDSRTLQSNTDGTEVFKPVSRTTSTFELKGIDLGGNYNFKVDDALIEFEIPSSASTTDIKSKVEMALSVSGVSSTVAVDMVAGKPEITLTLTGEAGVALTGVEITKGSDSAPLTATLKASSSTGVDFFKMLGDFHAALKSDVRSDISRALSELSSAQGNIAGSLGEIGGKLNTVQRQQDINADLSLQVDSLLSSEEDLDYAKAVTQFNAEMVRLEATQATFAKVAQLSLFQFI